MMVKMYFSWVETSTKNASLPTACPVMETTKNEAHPRASYHLDHREWKERLQLTVEEKVLQLAVVR
jgi:hypothetical protein